ncbi:hypothetical protein [Bradyrhizobium genosp. P]|uniref:hypothetical protein n=1 Tax=Bradyrhizobium genosp. P TaxID=83641 RepID=UPI003CF4C68F
MLRPIIGIAVMAPASMVGKCGSGKGRTLRWGGHGGGHFGSHGFGHAHFGGGRHGGAGSDPSRDTLARASAGSAMRLCVPQIFAMR